MKLGAFLLLACLAYSVAASAHYQTPDKSWTFTFRFENDLFAGTDEHYTNGIKISWISPDLSHFRDSDQLPDWGKRIINHLPYSQVEGLQRNIVFAIGQNMYTPADIKTQTLIRDDRPYAGWLYGSTAFHNKDYRHLDTFEVHAGIVGPLSLAQEAQDLVHELRGIDQANGWNHQLHNEPGLNLVYEHKDRIITLVTLAGFGFDAITHYGGALGNIFTYANAGVEARVGWNLPTDFGTSLIRPGGETNAPADTQDPRYRTIGHGFSVHAFAAVSGRLVLRDIFLDGNTIRDSHSVDKNYLVGDLVVGASLVVNGFKLSYAQVIRTREFKGQRQGNDFGSITVSYTY